jgi:hypothetical protein
MPLASEMIGRLRGGEDRNGAWREVAGRRPPRRGDGAGHRDQHRAEPADREDPAVGVQAWVWFCHPGQADRQQRGEREGECHRQAGRGGSDRRRPAGADRHQLAAARPERPQRGVVGGFGKAQAGQYLSQDEDGDGAEDAGEQPQGDCLQVDRMLGVRRLRVARDATRNLAVGETGELALYRRHVGTTVTEPQYGLGEGLGDFCPVRAPKGWGRPDMTRPGIDLRRELGGRGLDPSDPERERDWLAARGLQHDPKGVSWSQMARLRHHERDVDLIGPAGIGKSPGDDLPLPEAAGYPVVFRCEQGDVVRCH